MGQVLGKKTDKTGETGRAEENVRLLGTHRPPGHNAFTGDNHRLAPLQVLDDVRNAKLPNDRQIVEKRPRFAILRLNRCGLVARFVERLARQKLDNGRIRLGGATEEQGIDAQSLDHRFQFAAAGIGAVPHQIGVQAAEKRRAIVSQSGPKHFDCVFFDQLAHGAFSLTFGRSNPKEAAPCCVGHPSASSPRTR